MKLLSKHSVGMKQYIDILQYNTSEGYQYIAYSIVLLQATNYTAWMTNGFFTFVNVESRMFGQSCVSAFTIIYKNQNSNEMVFLQNLFTYFNTKDNTQYGTT